MVDHLGHWGEHEERFSSDPLPVFFAGDSCEQFWHRQICSVFDVVHPAFRLLTMALPTIQGALKDGSGEAVMVGDMPKLCKFWS